MTGIGNITGKITKLTDSIINDEHIPDKRKNIWIDEINIFFKDLECSTINFKENGPHYLMFRDLSYMTQEDDNEITKDDYVN
jgi:hypothetical protein